MCSGSKSCINGRIMDTVVVDNTIRTFTSNTVAGTMLAAVIMIVLLQLCVFALFWQNRVFHKNALTKPTPSVHSKL